MANWEYKVLSSGKGGFASPTLLEKFLNDLGQEEWEIVHFQTQPDNPLAFTGVARRSTQRDWTLEDAAKAAARAEADKLRAEFEAKFKAATGSSPEAGAEDKAETFLAEERVGADDGFRRPVDTSRDQDPDAAEDENGEKDEWDKLSEEDELPTFFEALRPHMRRNQRGPGMSVGVDFLAKKWKLDESDIKGALVECGLQIPADENARPVHVEFDGDLYWVNINRRGEVWINVREKPEPKFRIVQGRRIADEQSGEAGAGEPKPADAGESQPQTAREEREAAPQQQHHHHHQQQQAAPKTFLGKIRTMMRRNRHGQGWSGSFGYLTKALKTDESGLLAQLAETGLKLAEEGAEKPAYHEEEGFLYWMQKNQRGEIWINARKEKKTDGGPSAESDGGDQPAAAEPTEESPPGNPPPPEAGQSEATAPEATASGNVLAAVRLLMQPKKRGDGVAAQVGDLADQLGRPAIELLEALVAAGLNVPDDPKDKPKFGETGGEIFWLNRNAKDELWLNAKSAKASRSRSRRKKDDSADQGDDSGDAADAVEEPAEEAKD